MPAITASAVSSLILSTSSSHWRAWMVQGISNSAHTARARSTLNPVSWPLTSRKLKGGKSSVVRKRSEATALASGRSIRRLGSQKFGITTPLASAPVAPSCCADCSAVGAGDCAAAETANSFAGAIAAAWAKTLEIMARWPSLARATRRWCPDNNGRTKGGNRVAGDRRDQAANPTGGSCSAKPPQTSPFRNVTDRWIASQRRRPAWNKAVQPAKPADRCQRHDTAPFRIPEN